eukprot:13377544-Alexandrium_andersonii.AAC.1
MKNSRAARVSPSKAPPPYPYAREVAAVQGHVDLGCHALGKNLGLEIGSSVAQELRRRPGDVRQGHAFEDALE